MVEVDLNPQGVLGDENPPAEEAAMAATSAAAGGRDPYGRVDPEVPRIRSKYHTPESLGSLRGLIEDKRELDRVDCFPCSVDDRLYFSSKNPDFFFMHERVLTRAQAHLPSTVFESVVLRALNVAPSQLHPNS